jgi:hypothetical protein
MEIITIEKASSYYYNYYLKIIVQLFLVMIVLFIGSPDDNKPNQMSAQMFCVHHNLKREEDNLASSLFEKK